MSNNAFTISSLFISVLINLVYFSKRRVSTMETKIYSIIIVTNLINIFLALTSHMTTANIDLVPIINAIITKSLLGCYFVMITLYTVYVWIISHKKDNDENLNVKKSIIIIFSIYVLIVITLLYLLPLYYSNNQNTIYSYGPSANLVFILAGINILMWLFMMIKNYKNMKNKKYFPIYIFIIMIPIVAIIQKIYPELLLLTATETFVTLIMFFTIENPDVKMIEQLDLAKSQAEKANLAKTEFLSSMSHEIRTPLNAILGFSQSISESDVSDSIKEDIKDISMASNNLLQLVNGILDISKIEAGKLEIINTEYNTNKLLDEIVALAKGRLGEKELDFRTNFDRALPSVLYGDHLRLKQIIINLLTNAIKYTNEGYIDFRISSVVKDDVCRLIISVEDSGIGIPKDKINNLFTKFERMGVEKYSSIEGTGLGLAITKKLVDLMGGTILVQSEYGEGSRFTVAIDQRVVTDPQTVSSLENTMRLDLKDLKFDNKKVLVVDDNKLNIKVASRLLKDYNVIVEEATSGQECLDKIMSGNKYNLILLDDMMPNMDGMETLKKLREINGFNIPIVVITANAIVGMREKYLGYGFDEYIPKPIERSTLNKIMKKFLG